MSALGRRYLGVHCDVAKDADVERLRDEAVGEMGHVDIVMSNAGVAMIGPPEGLSMEEWDWILQINLYGVIRSVRAFLPHLLERGSGYSREHRVGRRPLRLLLGPPGIHHRQKAGRQHTVRDHARPSPELEPHDNAPEAAGPISPPDTAL